jgi:pterin-4a-carbinolamine dehydratase
VKRQLRDLEPQQTSARVLLGNTVVIELTTHDAGGLSDLDVELARRINALAD